MLGKHDTGVEQWGFSSNEIYIIFCDSVCRTGSSGGKTDTDNH